LRKKPKVERGPNVRSAIRQPQITTTSGVRHPRVDACGNEVLSAIEEAFRSVQRAIKRAAEATDSSRDDNAESIKKARMQGGNANSVCYAPLRAPHHNKL
jgi:hypothetical protein